MQYISPKKTWSATESIYGSVTNSMRNIWLASLGATSLTKKQVSRVVEKAIDKGAEFERDSLQYLQRAKSKSEKQVAEVAEQLIETAEKAETTLARKVATETMTYHLVPDAENWAVRREGYDADISVHPTKQSALSAARGIAQAHEPSRLVVHRADGTIQTSYSYGEEQ